MAQTVMHPVQTGKAVATAAAHPVQTTKSVVGEIKKDAADFKDAIKRGDGRAAGNAIGYTTTTVGAGIVAPEARAAEAVQTARAASTVARAVTATDRISAATAAKTSAARSASAADRANTAGAVGKATSGATKTTILEPIGKPAQFANNQLLHGHFNKHGPEVGATTATDYRNKAAHFLTNPIKVDTLEKVRKNGDIVRYNPKTNEFGVIGSDGTMKTYFKPTRGIDYFNDQ